MGAYWYRWRAKRGRNRRICSGQRFRKLLLVRRRHRYRGYAMRAARYEDSDSSPRYGSSLMASPSIVCLSTIDWDFLWQRHQILMASFARRGIPVLYVENIGGGAL